MSNRSDRRSKGRMSDTIKGSGTNPKNTYKIKNVSGAHAPGEAIKSLYTLK